MGKYTVGFMEQLSDAVGMKLDECYGLKSFTVNVLGQSLHSGHVYDAAPDMLEVLEELEWCMKYNTCPVCGCGSHHKETCKLSAALRKARGETT